MYYLTSIKATKLLGSSEAFLWSMHFVSKHLLSLRQLVRLFIRKPDSRASAGFVLVVLDDQALRAISDALESVKDLLK